MAKLELLAKKNQDGSFSVSMEVQQLISSTYVDFYDEKSGSGYQRLEPNRESRARAIAKYMQRCKSKAITPSLFEMTGNIRTDSAKAVFEPLDENGHLGILTITGKNRPISIIDGGTRLLGLEMALTNGVVSPIETYDLRLFLGLTFTEEISQFLLINDTQKKVRTDLSLRVVQRSLDDNSLSESEKVVLQTVVPPNEAWKFQASRITAKMNNDAGSPWHGLIQMPGDNATKPVKMQAFFTSLKPLITNEDLKTHYDQQVKNGVAEDEDEILTKIIRNFWIAVKNVNPDAHREVSTNVLWGSIGVNACHIGLAPILLSILESSHPVVTVDRFTQMIDESKIAEYEYWFTKAGGLKEYYPNQKGDATMMTGASNYNRLGKTLEQEWRSKLHASRDIPKLKF